MVNHPTRGRRSPLLDLAAEMFPRRGTITRDEMGAYLRAAEAAGLDISADGYAPHTGDDLPTAWAAACRDSTLISVVDGARDPGAPASVNRGGIRYDQPGNTYPGYMVTLMFAPAALRDHPYNQIGQMRRYCRRLIVVR